jgi:hypothetical protein
MGMPGQYQVNPGGGVYLSQSGQMMYGQPQAANPQMMASAVRSGRGGSKKRGKMKKCTCCFKTEYVV